MNSWRFGVPKLIPGASCFDGFANGSGGSDGFVKGSDGTLCARLVMMTPEGWIR